MFLRNSQNSQRINRIISGGIYNSQFRQFWFSSDSSNWKKYKKELNKEKSIYDIFFSNLPPLMNDYQQQEKFGNQLGLKARKSYQKQQLDEIQQQQMEKLKYQQNYSYFEYDGESDVNKNKMNIYEQKQKKKQLQQINKDNNNMIDKKQQLYGNRYKTREESSYLRYIQAKDNAILSTQQQQDEKEGIKERQREYIELIKNMKVGSIIENNMGMMNFYRQGKSMFWSSLFYIGLFTQVCHGLPFPYLFYAFGKAMSATALVGIFFFPGQIQQQNTQDALPLMKTTTPRSILYAIGCAGFCLQLMPYLQFMDTDVLFAKMGISLFAWKASGWIMMQIPYKRAQMVEICLAIQMLICLTQISTYSDTIFVWTTLNCLLNLRIVEEYFSENPDHIYYSLMYLWVVFSLFQALSQEQLDSQQQQESQSNTEISGSNNTKQQQQQQQQQNVDNTIQGEVKQNEQPKIQQNSNINKQQKQQNKDLNQNDNNDSNKQKKIND